MKNSKLLIFILSVILLIVVIKFMKGCRFKEGFKIFKISKITYDDSIRGGMSFSKWPEKQLNHNIKETIKKLNLAIDQINANNAEIDALTTELSDYATKTELSDYATKTELSEYSKTTELPDYATKTELYNIIGIKPNYQ